MWLKLRYVVEKRNKDGTSRWYWQRPGQLTRRLPDHEVARLEMAGRLNDEADAEKRNGPKPRPEYGTIAWAVHTYRQSQRFRKLSNSTKDAYEYWLERLTKTVGHRHLSDLTPKSVGAIIDAIPSHGRKTHCKAVLSAIARVGIKNWIIQANPVQAVEIEGSKKRSVVWSDDEITRFLEACEGEPSGEAIALGFQIMRWTGQRPSDVRALRWNDYDGKTIRLRQIKTDAFVEVPVMGPLRQVLEAAKAKRTGVFVVAKKTGKPMTKAGWTFRFRAIADKAGLQHLQARDLRRTLATRLVEEAEATPFQLSSIFGWSIDRSMKVIEHYVPRRSQAGKAAMLKLFPENTD